MATIDLVLIIATASLIIQATVLLLLGFGYIAKRDFNYRRHGTFMTAAVGLHAVTVFAIMIPSITLLPKYIINAPFSAPSIIGLLHGVAGTTAFVLGLVLIVAWGFSTNFSGCFARKKFMLITITAWITAVLLGISLFAVAYGPLLFS